MFKLEFPSENKSLAAAIGAALVSYAGAENVSSITVGNTRLHPSPKTDPLAQAAADADGTGYAGLDDAAIADLDSVKLNDSASGQSESQSDVSAETQVQETVEHAAGGVPDVDKNGVPPNWSYCAKAAKPFYASGKYAGQWKKGTKVEQAAYDTWYTAARADANALHPANANKQAEDFDTSTAFSADKKPAAGPAVAPVGIGPFIMWTSEMQTAGHLTQADITEAYTLLGLEQKDISPIESNAQANITSLHAVLSAKVPA